MIGVKEKKGFSLMEVMVSVLLFVVIIMSATEIFRLVIEGQRNAIASQNVQESLKYFFEVIGKEIRMAKRDNGKCVDVPDDKIFMLNAGANVLKFRNFYDECVAYYLETDGDNQRFKIERTKDGVLASGFISPDKIRIESLDFALDETGQPLVTINIKAYALGENRFKSEMEIQTSISSRYYQ